MGRADRSVRVVGAVAVAMVALGAIVAAVADDPVDPPAPAVVALPDHDPAAAVAFVDAYRRSRDVAIELSGTWTRRIVPGGPSISREWAMVQSPPDRLVRSGADVTAVVGDRRFTCTTDPDDAIVCRADDAGDADPVAAMEALVRGGRYAVFAGSPGCHVVRLVVPVAAPPLGTRATYCFDAATGALVEVRTERPGAVDVLEVVVVSTTPADVRTLVAEMLRAPGTGDSAVPGG